jgi:hypothetical protein
MKALSFEQFFGLTPKEKYDYFCKLTGTNNHTTNEYDRIDSILLSEWYFDKVNKPFSLELVNELFDCNYFDKRYKDYLEINDIPIRIVEIELNQQLSKHYPILYGDLTFESLPRTINDFSTDCQRVGVELHWRVK